MLTSFRLGKEGIRVQLEGNIPAIMPIRQMAAKIKLVNCFCELKVIWDVEGVNVKSAKITKPINERLVYENERRLFDVTSGLFKTRTTL